MYGCLLVLLCLLSSVAAWAQTCTRWASPAGGGNGLSQSSPYQINSFWSTAAAGNVLCLLDGTYTGANSMINPPDGTSGTSGNPIIVRALNEGQVLITGQNARNPIILQAGNNYIRVQGVNACCSSGTVVLADDSIGVEILRVVAWDAKDANYNVFSMTGTGGSHLFEDVAGFGIGRKIFESSQGGSSATNPSIYRRAFCRWDGNHWRGPKSCGTIMYNNTHMLWENLVGTWSQSRMVFPYILGCDAGDDHPSCGTSFTTIEQADGIFGGASNSTTDATNTRMLGSIAYVPAGGTYQPSNLIDGESLGYTYSNLVAYIPNSFTGKQSFNFVNVGTVNSTATNITGVSNGGATIQSDWTVTNQEQATSTAGIDSIFTGANGARICYRYQNGTLTGTPLWPWPMNQRIIDAMTAAGAANPVNVTATIESIFGTIPSACRWDTVTLLPPQQFHKVSP